MILRRASAAPGPAPSYEGDDRTDQHHNSGSHRENSNPLPDPALFFFIVMSLASCFSVPVVDLNTACDVSSDSAGPPVLSLQSATLLPVPQLPFEAHALRDPKHRDHTTFDCLAALCGSLARTSKFPPRTVEVSRKGVMIAGLNLGQ